MSFDSSRVLRANVAAGLALCLAGAACGGGTDIPAFTGQQGVAAADLDGDALVDLVQVTTYFAGPPPHPGSVSVLLHEPSADEGFLEPTKYDVGADPWDLVVGDIDGDGDPDLAVANTNSDSVSVHYQDDSAPGTFEPSVDVPCGRSPYAVALGSLSADSLTDMAVALRSRPLGGAVILVQTSTAPGGFAAGPRISTGTGARAVAVGDLNQDGRDDVAYTGGEAVFASFQSATSPGTFSTPVELATGLRPEAVAIGDLDGDGTNDLAAVDPGTAEAGRNSSVIILLQRAGSPGAFEPADTYASPDGTRDLVLADLDDDGVMDVAVSALVLQSQGPGNVAVFLGDGSTPGRLLAPTIYEAAFSTQFITAADVNGDDLLDLIVNGETDRGNLAGAPGIFPQDPGQPGTFEPLRFVDE